MPSHHPDLTTFRALSFDCYGTLIDWESGITSDLAPLLSRLPTSHPWRANPISAAKRFDDLANTLQQSQPRLPYNENLPQSYLQLAQELGINTTDDAAIAKEAEHVGTGPGRWSAFPDTVAGLKKLARYYKLIILSNVDESNIARAVAGPLAGARFDAVYTAQAIGSYKPAHGNFKYLFDGVKREFGVDHEGRGELLHVARSLTADHVPAKELGLRSVWIARGGDKEEGYGTGGDYEKLKGEGRLGFEWVFQTIGEFADEVERQFGEKGKTRQE